MTVQIVTQRFRQAAGIPDDPARARGITILLVDNFLMWAGFFMVVPLISVHYVGGLGWAAAAVGGVLAVRQFVQQGVTVFSGALADRFGAKGLILGGLLVRAVGFVSLAWADSFALLMLSGLLAGLGGALFESPKSAAVTALSDEATRRRVFALQGTLGNVGMALGVLAGGLLIRASFDAVAVVAGLCYVLCYGITAFLLPPVRVSSGERGLLEGIGMALRDRRFVGFTAVSMGYFMLWVQLSLSIALQAERLAGTSTAVSWVFLLNTVISVGLQYPLVRALEGRLSPLRALVLGTVVMSTGLGLIALAGSIVALLACVAVFALGVVILSPHQQVVMAELADPRALGSYMGFGWLGLAVGGALGNLAGGVLLDWGRASGLEALPWLVFAAVGYLSALGLVLFERAARPAASH
ncbi:MFS transporter [Calidithermus chliarophilus]|uniref:MFS transporter n=1 Tax=Calidithermus chliarophilus TaxID=52023 RepID=UPI00040D4F33|nr:MFS transporter [Calidithermus chliarophilus]